MKYAFTCLLLTALAFPQSAPTDSPTGESASPGPSAPAVPSDPENTRQARALLDQAISALGGPAYLNIQDIKQEGRSYSFHRGEPKGAGLKFTRVRKLWDKDRVDYTASHDIDVELIFGIEIPMGTSKTRFSVIYNGDKGYEITNMGVRDMDVKEQLAPYLRRRHYTLDTVLRRWLNEPGVALFYEGQTIAAQKQADRVTVMNTKNEAVTLYFDSTTHLPVKKSFTWRDPDDKQRNVEEEIFDNYRQVQSVMMPYDTTLFFNGEMAGQIFLNSASYNQGVGDSLFDPKTASSAGNAH